MMDFRGFLSCFAIASVAIALWGHLPNQLIDRPARRRVILGIVMGLGAVASMSVPLHLETGFIADFRHPLVGATAFIGGAVSAVIAAAIVLIFRAWIGGPGLLAALCTVSLTAAFGVIGHRIAAGRPAGKIGVTLLAAAVACSRPLGALWIPVEPGTATLSYLGPMAALTFVCTWLFVLSLQRDERLRALLAHDAVYRAIMEALPDCLTAKDTQSRFVAANPATARLMGAVSAADLIGKTDADYYSPDMAAMFRAEEIEVLGNKVMQPVDQEVTLKDGRRRWITSMKSPLFDRRGKVIGLVTHNRDITDRKRLEVELLKTQGYLQEAMNNMADGLVLYDRERRIRFCNRQYVTMFPLTADLRVRGALFDDIIHAMVARGEVETALSPDDYLAERLSSLGQSGESTLEFKDGRSIELRTRALPEFDTLVLFIDVTSKKQMERDLMRRASHDPLTGLANRAAFEFQLETIHRRACERRTAFAVIMVDLDRFKPVNDSFGHAVGDLLLVEVARRLQAAAGDEAPVARLGGDEFACLVVAEEIETVAATLANRLLGRLKQPFMIDGVELKPGGSLGIAYFPRHATNPFELLRLADKALYAVKTRGGGAWAVSGAATQDPQGPIRALSKPAA